MSSIHRDLHLLKKVTIIPALSFIFSTCGIDKAKGSDKQSIQGLYTVVKTSKNSRQGFSIIVGINTKLEDSKLLKIAQEVKENERLLADRGTIFFLLAGMEVNSGAWAAVDFAPDPSIRILGSTIENDVFIANAAPKVEKGVGIWVDDGIVRRIREISKNKFVIEYVDLANPQEELPFPIPLSKAIKKGRTIFKNLKKTDEYFILEANGDLSSYDKDGFIVTYKQLR